jgi:GMP synthase (glutamine-hydrolysing)
MKPFLILQFRPDDRASDNEFEALVLRSGLSYDSVVRIRMEKNPEDSHIVLDDFSGIIMGGSPFNVSDSLIDKTEQQKLTERRVFSLMQEVMQRDFPCLGICYGMGILGSCCNGLVSKDNYGEEVGVVDIHLTHMGKQDPITRGIPPVFKAIVGHKEACQYLPPGTELLASSRTCPTQLIRYKNNVYATQFHPELDDEGVRVRALVYKNAGYFPASQVEEIIRRTTGYDLSASSKVLKNFVSIYTNQIL